MEIVKIAVFSPAHPSPKNPSKTVPAKATDGNDRTYIVPKALSEVVSANQGKPLEIEYETKTNGTFTDYVLTSAKTPEPPKEKVQGNGWGKSPDEAARICRQNALTNAVNAMGRFDGTAAYISSTLELAAVFARWNLDGIGAEAASKVVKEPNTVSPRRYTTGLREGEDLATAARRAVEEHDPFEDPNPPHPAETVDDGPSVRRPVPAARETLRASGPARR